MADAGLWTAGASQALPQSCESPKGLERRGFNTERRRGAETGVRIAGIIFKKNCKKAALFCIILMKKLKMEFKWLIYI